MRFPWQRQRPKPRPLILAGDAAAEAIAACRRADAALAELRAAVDQRRAALLHLAAEHGAGTSAKSLLNRALTPFAYWRAAAHHGLAGAFGSPHVSVRHAASMEAQIRSIVRITEGGPVTTTDPAPATAGDLLQEA